MKDYRTLALAQIQHDRICREVFQETNAQLVKWDVQDHPMGTGGKGFRIAADEARRQTDQAAERGAVTYFDILREEYYEAAAEESGEALENELIQVAAVAVSMVAASRRSRGVTNK